MVGARASFTKKQLDIVSLMYGGMSIKEVAIFLGMSASTVRTHIASIYRKNNIHNRMDLARIYTEYMEANGKNGDSKAYTH